MQPMSEATHLFTEDVSVKFYVEANWFILSLYKSKNFHWKKLWRNVFAWPVSQNFIPRKLPKYPNRKIFFPIFMVTLNRDSFF